MTAKVGNKTTRDNYEKISSIFDIILMKKNFL